MRKILISLVLISFMLTSKGQTTKGNWIVGGNGNFSRIKIHDEKGYYIHLSPNIGYFFFDKFAAGVKPGYEYEKHTGAGSITMQKRSINFGPFVRYYFLNTENPYNVLVEGSFQKGFERVKSEYNTKGDKHVLNSFSFSAGPVIYFNTCVGLELLVGYAESRYTSDDFSRGQIQLGIGLQVHLEND